MARGTDTTSMKVFASDHLALDSVVINIHLKSPNTPSQLFTFQCQGMTVTPFLSFPCQSAVPLISTRPGISDVLALSTDGALELVTSGGRNIPLTVAWLASPTAAVGDSSNHRVMADLTDPVGTRFTAVMTDGERLRVSADFIMSDPLVRMCVEAISLNVAAQSFYLLKRELMLHARSMTKRADPADIFRVFADVVSSMLGCSPSSPVAPTDAVGPILRRYTSRRRGQQDSAAMSCASALQATDTAPVLLALHLVAQNCRLFSHSRYLDSLAPLVLQLAHRLDKLDWVDHWMRIAPIEYQQDDVISKSPRRVSLSSRNRHHLLGYIWYSP